MREGERERERETGLGGEMNRNRSAAADDKRGQWRRICLVFPLWKKLLIPPKFIF